MSWYALIKWLHIVSSTVLFGTGAGIAFFFVRAQRSGDAKIIAAVSRDVVLADMIFTVSAVVLQPATGIALALIAGYRLSTPWLLLSMLLYGLIGCCWLPCIHRCAGHLLFDGGETRDLRLPTRRNSLYDRA
jgi:uncharacterized membrane protein